MTLRRNAAGDGQRPRIRLWTLGDPPEGSTLAKLQRHYLSAFEGVDRWDAKRAELKANQELTDIGKQRAALDFAFSAVMPDNLKARRTLRKAEMEVASKRAKLQQPKSDPGDLAAALRRQELRGIMRSLDDKGRDEFLRKNGLLTGLNPELRQALVEMPPSVSGISQQKHDEFMREATEALNGEALQEIQTLERAIEIAASALEEGKSEIQREAIAVDPAYADQDRFEARAVEAAALADPPATEELDRGGRGGPTRCVDLFSQRRRDVAKQRRERLLLIVLRLLTIITGSASPTAMRTRSQNGEVPRPRRPTVARRPFRTRRQCIVQFIDGRRFTQDAGRCRKVAARVVILSAS